MTGVGIAWASTLSMPYSMLAGALPEGKTGVYMGIFNFFIVIPEIVAALGFGWVMNNLLDNNRMAAVVAGGAFMALASVLVLRVKGVAASWQHRTLRKRSRRDHGGHAGVPVSGVSVMHGKPGAFGNARGVAAGGVVARAGADGRRRSSRPTGGPTHSGQPGARAGARQPSPALASNAGD
jgi:hypothetical protein